MSSTTFREVPPVLTLEVQEKKPDVFRMGCEGGHVVPIIFSGNIRGYYFFCDKREVTDLVTICLFPEEKVRFMGSFGFDDPVPISLAIERSPFGFGCKDKRSSFAVIVSARLIVEREAKGEKKKGGLIITP